MFTDSIKTQNTPSRSWRLETIQEIFYDRSRREVAEHLDAAFHAFNASRKHNLRLYRGVREGLETLSRSGFILVAHTESKLYAAIDRLTRLELTTYFRRIYCRKRSISEHPDPETGSRWLGKFPMEKVIELSHHQRKPDPDVLLEICRDEGVSPEEAAYVGDSMARDILMAKLAGVFAIWAKYGTLHREEDYRRLVRISHWTDEDVRRERILRQRTEDIEADFVLKTDFSEIVGALLPSAQPSIPKS